MKLNIKVFLLSFLVSCWMIPLSANAQNFSTQEKQGNQSSSEEDAIIEENVKAMLQAEQTNPSMGDELAAEYTLGKDDVIEVSVMRHPEVSGEYIVNRDGKIQYDFVGDVEVNGMTKEEVAGQLTEKLAEYIVSPEVTVKIIGYNSKIVYVVGEVGRPGKIFMRGDTITIREALMEAGLPTLNGITKKSRLITPSDDGKMAKTMVNVHALLYEGDLRENLVMNPGDVLYVPPTFLTKTMRAISPVTNPIREGAGTARQVSYGF